jgi:small-conductance mechanosensitive channel
MPTPQAREARAKAIREASRRVNRALGSFAVLIALAILAWFFIAQIAPKYIPHWPSEFTLYFDAAIIVVAALVGIRIVGQLIRAYAVPRTSPAVGSTLQLVFNIGAYTALLFGVFTFLGFNLSSALIGAGFLGIVLGLAAQTVLGNVIAAMALHAARPFVVGDRITFVLSTYGLQWQTYPHEALPAGYTGTVRETGLIYTTIDADDGSVIQVANGQLINALIMNLTRAKMRRLRVLVTVDQKVPPRTFLGLARPLLHDLPGGVSYDLRVVGSASATYDVVVLAMVPPTVDEEIFRSEVLQRLLTISQTPSAPADVLAPGHGFPPPS